jgi:hypothetical protein
MDDSQKHWILQIPFNHSVILALCIFYIVAPPYVAYYYVQPELYKSTDFIKLISFTTGIGVIVFSINYFLLFFIIYLSSRTDEMNALGKKPYEVKNPYETAGIWICIVYTLAFAIFMANSLSTDMIIPLFPIFRSVELLFLYTSCLCLVINVIRTLKASYDAVRYLRKTSTFYESELTEINKDIKNLRALIRESTIDEEDAIKKRDELVALENKERRLTSDKLAFIEKLQNRYKV